MEEDNWIQAANPEESQRNNQMLQATTLVQPVNTKGNLGTPITITRDIEMVKEKSVRQQL